jgi:RNA polymerase sigma-70 factor (ECF subfamily)
MGQGAIDVEAVYRKYGPMVLRRCRRLLRNEDEAWDVTQEVFVRVLRHRGRLRDTYPSSLLFRMATNLSLNRLRDRRREPAQPGDEVLHRIAILEDRDSALLLDRLFGRHPDSTRTIAVLHHVDGMTLAQVARECGMSVSGVRRRLRGLRASLEEMKRETP